jgi:hypothetical protein
MTLPYKPGHALVELINPRSRTYDERYIAYTGKALSDLFVDRLYGRIELPNEGKKIKIIVASYISAGGRGDHTLGLKAATLLKEIMPPQVDEIALVVPPDTPNRANLSHEQLCARSSMMKILSWETQPWWTTGLKCSLLKLSRRRRNGRVPLSSGRQCYGKIMNDVANEPSFYYIGEAAFSHNYYRDSPSDKNCVGFKSHELGVILQSIFLAIKRE